MKDSILLYKTLLHYKEGEREHIDEIKKRLIEKGFIL